MLAAVPLLALADGVTVVALPRHRHTHAAAVITAPTTTAAAAAATTSTTAAARATVSGMVTAAHLVGATSAPLPMPITITIPNRGQGTLNIDGVVVLAHPGAQVAWDGGQPLPITGTGSLQLGAATMDANRAGITWHLDGTPRYFLPGSYTAESAVAVGTGGLALALDQVGFTVTSGGQGRLESDGDAQVHFGPGPVSVAGPGVVELLGSLSVTTAGGTRTVTNLHAGSGAFSLTFLPAPGGYRVQGTLAGPLTFP